MAKAKWIPFPHPDKAYQYAGDALKKAWPRLHKGDCEPYPKETAAQDAWRLYHAGDFEGAVATGLEAGASGLERVDPFPQGRAVLRLAGDRLPERDRFVHPALVV